MSERWQTWLAKYEIWPLALGAILASFSLQTAPWGLGLLVLVWGFRWFRDGSLTVRTPLDWPMGILLGMIPVTLLVSVDRETTFLVVSRLFAGISLTYGVVNWNRSEEGLAFLVLGITSAGIALSLLTPFVTPYQPGRLNPFPVVLYNRLPHPLSDPLNPNMVAGILVMLLPFALGGLVFGLPGKLPSVRSFVPKFLVPIADSVLFRRLLFGIASLSILLALIVTQSRGGWLAAGVAVFVVLAARSKKFLGLLLLPIGVVTWLSLRGELQLVLDLLGSGGSISGWDQRVEIWSRALYMLQDFSFTGIGAGNYALVVEVLYPLFLASPDAVIPHAHNLLLQVGVDLGFPGLIAFCALVGMVLWLALCSVLVYQAMGKRVLMAFTWAGLASLLAMLVHGLVDATTWVIGWGAPLPWLVYGMLINLAISGKIERVTSTPIQEVS